MLIREYKPEDEEAVKRCIFELQDEDHERQPEYWNEPEKVSGYLEYLLRYLAKSKGKIFVAQLDSQVAGYVAVIIDEDDDKSPCLKITKSAYITDLVVLHEYRKNGIGKELIATAEKYAKSNNLDYIFLDVTAGNPALEFYRRQGYKNHSLSLNKKLE